MYILTQAQGFLQGIIFSEFENQRSDPAMPLYKYLFFKSVTLRLIAQNKCTWGSCLVNTSS